MQSVHATGTAFPVLAIILTLVMFANRRRRLEAEA